MVINRICEIKQENTRIENVALLMIPRRERESKKSTRKPLLYIKIYMKNSTYTNPAFRNSLIRSSSCGVVWF
jgi:hypothetical protein